MVRLALETGDPGKVYRVREGKEEERGKRRRGKGGGEGRKEEGRKEEERGRRRKWEEGGEVEEEVRGRRRRGEGGGEGKERGWKNCWLMYMYGSQNSSSGQVEHTMYSSPTGI